MPDGIYILSGFFCKVCYLFEGSYVDIGQISDDLMTAEVKKARDNTGGDEAAKKAAAQARAEELIKWWPNDYNHYTVDLSNLILPDVTKAVAELLKPQ